MFDWDKENIAHIARHGVTREEAEEAFKLAPMDIAELHHDEEVRYVQLGITSKGPVLLLVTTWPGYFVRVVTAYTASPSLRKLYASK